MCVFSYPPFCSSTLLTPFCSFAISSSLSCTPFFSLFLSLVFCRSVKISSFSRWSSSKARCFSPCYIIDVLFFFFFSCFLLLLLLLLLLPHLFAIFLLSFIFWFSKNNGFQKKHTHTQHTKARPRQNFCDALKPLFLLWFQGMRPKRPKFRKRPFQGCTRNGAPPGRAVTKKKTQKTLRFNWAHPKNTKFPQQQQHMS